MEDKKAELLKKIVSLFTGDIRGVPKEGSLISKKLHTAIFYIDHDMYEVKVAKCHMSKSNVVTPC